MTACLEMVTFKLSDGADPEAFAAAAPEITAWAAKQPGFQYRTLVNRGEDNATEDAKMKDNFEKHLLHVKTMVKVKDNFEMLEVNHRDAIDDPVKVAASVNAFLGGSLDETAMAGVVDKKLHRNRQEDLAGQAS